MLNNIHPLVCVLIFWNITVFIQYGYDKKQARKKAWRLSEKQLLLSTLSCGGFGGLLGMYVFRHKIKKWYFYVCAWIGCLVSLYASSLF